MSFKQKCCVELDKLVYFKSVVLKEGIQKCCAELSKEFFKLRPSGNWQDKEIYIHDELVSKVESLGYNNKDAHKIISIAISMNNALYKRRERVFKKIKETMQNSIYPVYFGTLTFKDSVLNSTSTATRRRYVSRYLKKVGFSYIANIDFGDKVKNPDSNEREHYHCIICCKDKPLSWEYGYCCFKEVKKEDLDELRISKYITKLSFHALKQSKTYDAPKLLYSRGNLPF